MRAITFKACSVALVMIVCAGAAAQDSKDSPKNFDPGKPFANVTTAAQWVGKFRTGKPAIIANDPFGNMTSADFWHQSWQGQNVDHPERTPATVKGSGGAGVVIKSPYPYKTALEHYNAWLAAAHGGTKYTNANLPDWSGDWQGRSDGVLGNGAKVTDVYNAVSDAYKPRFLEILRGEWSDAHQWWPATFCLPDAFGRLYWAGGTWHFMRDSQMVLINQDRPENATRFIYTDGRGFLSKDKQFDEWFGESKGFWDGNELVIYTTHIKPWVMTHGMPEYSDQLETVERVKRLGDDIVIDITLYDPKAFAFPWHDTATFHRLKDWTTAPATWFECTSTNNVYLDAKGDLAIYAPGDPGYRDASDPRPWASAYELWDKNHGAEADHWKNVFDQTAAALKSR